VEGEVFTVPPFDVGIATASSTVVGIAHGVLEVRDGSRSSQFDDDLGNASVISVCFSRDVEASGAVVTKEGDFEVRRRVSFVVVVDGNISFFRTVNVEKTYFVDINGVVEVEPNLSTDGSVVGRLVRSALVNNQDVSEGHTVGILAKVGVVVLRNSWSSIIAKFVGRTEIGISTGV
jgi:hypothetical protein